MEVYKDSGFLVVVPPPRFLWKLIFTCFFLFSKQKTNQKVLYLINFYIEILYYIHRKYKKQTNTKNNFQRKQRCNSPKQPTQPQQTNTQQPPPHTTKKTNTPKQKPPNKKQTPNHQRILLNKRSSSFFHACRDRRLRIYWTRPRAEASGARREGQSHRSCSPPLPPPKPLFRQKISPRRPFPGTQGLCGSLPFRGPPRGREFRQPPVADAGSQPHRLAQCLQDSRGAGSEESGVFLLLGSLRRAARASHQRGDRQGPGVHLRGVEACGRDVRARLRARIENGIPHRALLQRLRARPADVEEAHDVEFR